MLLEDVAYILCINVEKTQKSFEVTEITVNAYSIIW